MLEFSSKPCPVVCGVVLLTPEIETTVVIIVLIMEVLSFLFGDVTFRFGMNVT